MLPEYLGEIDFDEIIVHEAEHDTHGPRGNVLVGLRQHHPIPQSKGRCGGRRESRRSFFLGRRLRSGLCGGLRPCFGSPRVVCGTDGRGLPLIFLFGFTRLDPGFPFGRRGRFAVNKLGALKIACFKFEFELRRDIQNGTRMAQKGICQNNIKIGHLT